MEQKTPEPYPSGPLSPSLDTKDRLKTRKMA